MHTAMPCAACSIAFVCRLRLRHLEQSATAPDLIPEFQTDLQLTIHFTSSCLPALYSRLFFQGLISLSVSLVINQASSRGVDFCTSHPLNYYSTTKSAIAALSQEIHYTPLLPFASCVRDLATVLNCARPVQSHPISQPTLAAPKADL